MVYLRAARRRIARTWVLTRVLAGREFRIRYRQSVLEVAWSLVTPVVVMVVYGVVLTTVFDVSGGGVPYLSLVWTGMVVWTMFATSVGGGVTSLLSSGDLLSKIYFPREALPLAVTGASVFDLGIAVAVLLVLVVVQIQAIAITAVAAIPVLAVVLVWSAAVSILVGVLAVFARDVVHVTRLALQVGFFATPVMYASSDVSGVLATVNRCNPLAVCIDALRDALLYQRWPDLALVAIHGAVGLALLVGAIAYTQLVEDRMVDVL